MKRIAIIAALVLSVGAAHADPVTVIAPKAPVSQEAAELYVAKLEKAVKQVCFDAASPVIGLNHYAYLACIKATRAEVAKQDPTGLYSERDSTDGMVLAAK